MFILLDRKHGIFASLLFLFFTVSAVYCREAKCLTRMGVSIPEGAKMVLLQVLSPKSRRDEQLGRERQQPNKKPASRANAFLRVLY